MALYVRRKVGKNLLRASRSPSKNAASIDEVQKFIRHSDVKTTISHYISDDDPPGPDVLKTVHA